ncbi:MAG: hypothetical protein HY447_03865 [Candidatus Omnitrophica bacterium]|nr:hypothetical protein [Candidatus Omnitrophota bacterium]
MKRKSPFLTLFLILFLPTVVHAAELAPQGTMTRKFQRGLINTFLSPIEISHALAEAKEKSKGREEYFPSWITGGALGIYFMVIRATTGFYDMVTAPFPAPAGYEPLLKPEFSLDHLN